MLGVYLIDGYTAQLYQGHRRSTLILHVPPPNGYTLVPMTMFKVELDRVHQVLAHLTQKYAWTLDFASLEGSAEYAFTNDPYASGAPTHSIETILF